MNMYIPTKTQLKYCRYSRKSSEAKERQVMSIGDQNKSCLEYAQYVYIDDKIVLEIDEAKSAFKPNKREKFNKLIELIQKGEINAILT
ncbi:MAG: hypothetical protein KatS3mg087_1273 [Patescibacteria group bacterium]|nr:MAG: hypothetical protein KatS3mg087_1273 [Patescibacteria group bacterium]